MANTLEFERKNNESVCTLPSNTSVVQITLKNTARVVITASLEGGGG